MKLTPTQQKAVDHRGSNLLVSASAGSGKTHVLAHRVLALLTDRTRPCSIDRLLVVTFTRAAAAELRVRIAELLRDAARQCPAGEPRDFLRRQEVLVESADIGTIDAWCARIVREHFVQADVDPGFGVLGEQEAVLLRREVLDALMDWVCSADDGLARRARGWMADGTHPDDNTVRDIVQTLAEFREHPLSPAHWMAARRSACEQPDDVLRAAARQLLSRALCRECRFQAGQMDLVAEQADRASAAYVRQYQSELLGWAERLADGPAAGPLGTTTLDEVARQIAGYKPVPKRTADPTGLLAELKKRWIEKRLRKRAAPDRLAAILEDAPLLARHTLTLLDLEQRYQRMLAAVKRERGVLEFADVLRRTLDLSSVPNLYGQREATPIARALRERYEHILVDEYQDTSPVQVEILRLVTRDGRGNRFMVGDVKQSIYGFREAEPRLFVELQRAIAGGEQPGRVIHLSDNFRSHAGLVEGLNRLFAMLFAPQLGGSPYGEDERLRARRDELPNPTMTAESRVEVHVVEEARGHRGPHDDEETQAIEREACLAAQRVREMLAAGAQVLDKGESGGPRLRAMRLSDVVVLLRSAKGHAVKVAKVLREAGLPCVTCGRDAILDSIEVADVRNALALLANRRQDLPLAAYLRGPMVGLDEAALLAVRAAAPKSDYFGAVAAYRRDGPDAALREQLAKAIGQLDRWAAAARHEGLPAVVRRIVQETRLPLFARGLRGGEHRVAVLHALEDVAAAFARGGQQGPGDLARYLDALETRKLEAGVQVATAENVIRIMTIHAAKGLEFPVVFLLNGGARFNQSSGPVFCSADGDLGIRYSDYPALRDRMSATYHVERIDARERELEEELRLLYVAATRARERLFVIGHARPGAWDAARQRYADTGTPPPLITRLTAQNMLEWVLSAAAGAGLGDDHGDDAPPLRVVTHRVQDVPQRHRTEPPTAPEAETSDPADDTWVERADALLHTEIDLTATKTPAVISVSAAKQLATRDEPAPAPFAQVQASLAWPAFHESRSNGARRGAAGGDARRLGTACHRFLERADLSRLGDDRQVRAQIAELVERGELPDDDARLVPAADIAWFAGTDLGTLLASRANGVRRELPFVFGLRQSDGAGRGDGPIIRGVIDCLVDTDDGLVLLDYKADRVEDDEFERRVAQYRVQLQLYAAAAAALFDRPVVRATLAFLRMRRLVDVPVEMPHDLLAAIATPVLE